MTFSEGTIAIIPARGGSKRIPRKNIIDFHGKPLIAWTIEAALKSGVYEHVIVSTEDKEIADVAKEHGAEVPFLRHHEYHDQSPVPAAVIAAQIQAEAYYQKQFTTVAMLLPTCPFRGPGVIHQAHEFFIERQACSVISCYPAPGMPWWSHRLSADFVPVPLFPDQLRKGSQELEKLYLPTGSIWIANGQHLVTAGNFYAPGYLFFPIDAKAAIDIDTLEDLELARVTFNLFGQV
jgi:N-acylneuraminate cytidylyltransferase